MCLYTAETKLKTAKEDIICYKVLIHYPSSTILYTPYVYKTIKFIDMFLHNPIKADGLVRKRKQFKNYQPSFNLGLIHTYITARDAQTIITAPEYKLYQCIIPKRTKYIDGYDGMGKLTYASKQIIIQQQIKQ